MFNTRFHLSFICLNTHFFRFYKIFWYKIYFWYILDSCIYYGVHAFKHMYRNIKSLEPHIFTTAKTSHSLIKKPEREGTMGCLLHQYPKFYNKVFLFFGLITIRTWVNFDWLAQTFQPLIVIYRRGNFVYHHWECI